MKRLRKSTWLNWPRHFAIHRPPRIIVVFFSIFIAALLVDVAMPTSRSFFTEAWHQSAWDVKLSNLNRTSRGIDVLKTKGPMAHALAVRIAATEVLRHSASSVAFAKLGLQVAKRGESEDPENGFWPQASASFEAYLQDDAESIADWNQAATKVDWQDEQAAYLLSQFPTTEPVPAYVYAEMLKLRSVSASQLIYQTAQNLWSKLYNSRSTNVAFQYNTLRNGYLIRKHAKSLYQMETGINLCALILLPPNAIVPPGYHAMLVARLQLSDAIRKAYPLSIVSVDTMFRENDAEAALTSSTDIPAEKTKLSRTAAIVSCLPGSILIAIPSLTILAMVLALGHVAHGGSEADRLKRSVIFVAIISILAVAFVPISAALTLVAASLFVLASPKNARKHPPEDLGPLFRYTMVILGILWVFASTVFCLLQSFPGKSLLQLSPISPIDLFTGISALIISALFVSASMWGFAQRVSTAYVLKNGIRLVCTTAIWAALVAAVISAPICVHEDKIVRGSLQNMVANEPLYFLAK